MSDPPFKRGRLSKSSKLINQLWKDGKCRQCSVSVARMDFAKMMGTFTKVKIQYSSSSPTKENAAPAKTKSQPSPIANSRLKSNENGMVQIHRTAYKPHPVKQAAKKKEPITKVKTPEVAKTAVKPSSPKVGTPKQYKNKRQPTKASPPAKCYGIEFCLPTMKPEDDSTISQTALVELLPHINSNILPSNDWTIDVLTEESEPEKDHIYDRIAAELEDLMYNDKIPTDTTKSSSDMKNDDFPTIMDILNDNLSGKPDKSSDEQANSEIDTTNIEALLSGDKVVKPSDTTSKEPISPKKVEPSETSNILPESTPEETIDPTAVIDEALKKAVAEQLPDEKPLETKSALTSLTNGPGSLGKSDLEPMEVVNQSTQSPLKQDNNSEGKTVQFIVFKQIKNNECCRSVKCFKNLRYNVEIEGKYVELVAAPKFITTIEDAKVLLEIVNDCDLNSFNIVQ